MKPKILLAAMPQDSQFTPLAVLGYCLTRSHFLAPLFSECKLPMKVIRHRPDEKFLDLLVSILAGCRSISQVNTRIRPDKALARAWGRQQFAAQATLARTLDAFTQLQIMQLRQGVEALFRRESRTLRHDFSLSWLWLDIDLTPLPASKHAEGSTKGKIGGKKNSLDVQDFNLS